MNRDTKSNKLEPLRPFGRVSFGIEPRDIEIINRNEHDPSTISIKPIK